MSLVSQRERNIFNLSVNKNILIQILIGFSIVLGESKFNVPKDWRHIKFIV